MNIQQPCVSFLCRPASVCVCAGWPSHKSCGNASPPLPQCSYCEADPVWQQEGLLAGWPALYIGGIHQWVCGFSVVVCSTSTACLLCMTVLGSSVIGKGGG